MLFYCIMLFFFSLIFAVLGLGNFELNSNMNIEGRLLRAAGGGKGGSSGGTNSKDGGGVMGGEADGGGSGNRGAMPPEFQSIGLLAGSFFWTF